MESTLKKIEQNKYELTVELGKEELARYVKLAESRISQEVKVDGFRKGKVPQDMLRKEVGDKFILEEALDLAVRDSLAKTIEKENLEVLNVSDLNIKENSASKLLYTTKISLFPAIAIGNLVGLKVKRKEINVEPKEIEDALDFIRTSRSKLIAKDTPAEKGDRLEIDFEVTADGLPVEGGVSKNHPLVIGDNKFIPGFEEQLIGMIIGGEKKFSLNAPKDYFHKSVAGRSLDFSVKVINIQQVQKPGLTDEFAKSLGRFTNLQELESNVSEGILEEKKMKERQRLRLAILAGILDKSKIELPKEMIDDQLNGMISRFDGELHAKGMELSIYLAHLNKTEDNLRKEWLPEAEKQVSFALLLKKIAKDKNIKVGPEEVEEAANRMIQTMTMRGELDKENLNVENLKEAVANDLVNEKVFTYLEQTYLA